MTTQIHDSTTCTAGFNGLPCLMCHFAREFEKSGAKSPSESLETENQPAGFLALEPESGLERNSTQSSPIPAAPDFDREWREAPEGHKRYTERSEAEWWLMRGVWLGIQYERERGLVALSGDLKEMQRRGCDALAAPASPAALRDEADRVSAFAGSERLSAQEDKPVKNYGDFRAGMLRAAEMARNEFKRAPEAAKGHDCVYMGGYEDACDHLSVVIAQAAVIDSVRIAGPQPDWQYHISLLLPEGIEDQALLKIFQVVEYELRAATTPPSTLAHKAAEEIAANYEVHKDHCHSNERYPSPPCDCGTVEEIAAIIERCFAAESERNAKNNSKEKD